MKVLWKILIKIQFQLEKIWQYHLDLKVGDKITLMSSAGIQTIVGNLPKQESFTISSIFNSGFAEFDQNVIFMPVEDAIPFFEASDDDLFLEIYLKKPEHVEEC